MDAVTALKFRHHGPGAKKRSIVSRTVMWPGENLIVFGKTILHARHLEKSVAQGPFRLIQFHRKSGVIADDVRRIIPGLVGHQAPIHELRARITGISVGIENVDSGEPSQREREPRNILFSSERELIVGHLFLRAAQADGLPNEQACEGAVGNRSANAIGFAAGKTFDAEHIVKAKPLPHEPVNVRFGSAPQAHSSHQIQRNGFARLAHAGQALRSGILRRKIRDNPGRCRCSEHENSKSGAGRWSPSQRLPSERRHYRVRRPASRSSAPMPAPGRAEDPQVRPIARSWRGNEMLGPR